MRYFFRQKIPSFERILVVESGSRHLTEHLLPMLRRSWNPRLSIDLVTCYTGLPAGYSAEDTLVFPISQYPGRAGRKRLYRELAQYTVVGILCSDEPIMTKWKWALAARLPAKLFIVNENGDFFWLDYSQWRTIRHFILFRAGLSGSNAVRTLVRLVLFPFTILFLLLYAVTVHARRAAFSLAGRKVSR